MMTLTEMKAMRRHIALPTPKAFASPALRAKSTGTPPYFAKLLKCALVLAPL